MTATAVTVDADQSIGVVGAGHWGPNLVRNFQGPPYFRLRWLCISTSAARNGRWSITPRCDLNILLDAPEVEAVAIATQTGTHAQLVMAALRAGKHVLVEKPLASTYAEAGN